LEQLEHDSVPYTRYLVGKKEEEVQKIMMAAENICSQRHRDTVETLGNSWVSTIDVGHQGDEKYWRKIDDRAYKVNGSLVLLREECSPVGNIDQMVALLLENSISLSEYVHGDKTVI
jgi:hypothetical protein